MAGDQPLLRFFRWNKFHGFLISWSGVSPEWTLSAAAADESLTTAARLLAKSAAADAMRSAATPRPAEPDCGRIFNYEVPSPSPCEPDGDRKFNDDVPSPPRCEPDCGRKFNDDVLSPPPREPDCVVIDKEEALLAVPPPRCLLTDVVASSETIEMFSSSKDSVAAVSSLLDPGLCLGLSHTHTIF